MTGRTQYGDLLHDASRHVLAASLALEGSAFVNRTAAEDAVGAWRDLLHALNRHGWQLFGSNVRVVGMLASSNVDPREAAAVRLVDELADHGRRGQDVPRSSSPVADAWIAAAMSVRTASDLLATHRDVHGGWRSPRAVILDDPSVRAMGFRYLAGLVVPVAEAAIHLGLRAGQAGVPWRGVARLVPQTTSLLTAAMEVRRLSNVPGDGSSLASLDVARPTVREGDPVVELADRLARLHRIAWQLTREPRIGIGTLADFAAGGVIVHAHAVRLLDAASAGSARDLAAHPLRSRTAEAGTAWRVAHSECRQLRTATPFLPRVRGDVAAVRCLLERVQSMVDHEQPGVHGRPESVILGGARAFADVARWNADVVNDLARTGQLYVPARLLSGDEVTNHPTLVGAKLADRVVGASKERLEPLRAAYERAQRSGFGTTASGQIAFQARAEVGQRLAV